MNEETTSNPVLQKPACFPAARSPGRPAPASPAWEALRGPWWPRWEGCPDAFWGRQARGLLHCSSPSRTVLDWQPPFARMV